MQVLRNATLPVSRWHNGAGRKADLATGDGWLVGFAWLDADAPFSLLPGMDRTITLVEGAGFSLDIAGATLVVDRALAPTAFDGGQPTQCRIAGPCRVMNVMTDRARFRHRVRVVTGAEQTLEPGTAVAALAVLLAGAGRVVAQGMGIALARLDAVRLDGAVTIVGGPGMTVGHLTVERV